LSLVVIFIGVCGFALWTRSQASEEPEVFFIGECSEIPDEFVSEFEALNVVCIGEDEAPQVLPTDEASLFGIKKGATNIQKIMNWARENNQKEVYFYYNEESPDEEVSYFKSSFGFFENMDFDTVLDYFSPESAIVATVEGPLCGVGNLRPSGYSYSWSCASDTAPCDNCPGDGRIAKMKVTLYYQHYDTCHGIPISDLAMDNLYRTVDSHSNPVNGVSLVTCMNAHNSGSPFMCIPINTTIEMYNGTSHPGYTCDDDPNIFGCAEGGTLTTPRKTIDNWIKLRQGKFVDNRWIVRHEELHNYGYSHGGGVNGCSSLGGSDSQAHCCGTHVVKP
jgi:hypothetical protein